MDKETLKITGMTCAACSARIEKVVSKMEGVEQISVNLATEKATVSYDPSLTDVSSIKAKIEKTGYGAAEIQAKKIVDQDKLSKEKEIKTLWRKFTVSAFSLYHCFILQWDQCSRGLTSRYLQLLT